jgi:Holliday junction resolvasome RuvABC endonuclease subunit
MNYLGIDPGLKGGFVVIDDQSRIVSMAKMSTAHDGKRNAVDPAGVWAIYLDAYYDAYSGLWRRRSSDYAGGVLLVAALEKIVAFQMGRTSALNYGEGAGFLKMGLVAAGIPYELVTPQRWKKSLGIPAGSPKPFSVTKALQLFPTAELTKKDDGLADALLMAEWLRRTRTGQDA